MMLSLMFSPNSDPCNCGFALPIGYNYLKERKRTKDQRSRLLFEVDALQKPLKEQIEAINKMLSVIRSGSSTRFGLTMVENLLI